MRYDGLLKSLEKATAVYETKVQQILQRYAKRDVTTASDLLSSLKPKSGKKHQDIDSYVFSAVRTMRKSKKPHWTQLPKNKARLRKQLVKAAKAKAAKVTNGTA